MESSTHPATELDYTSRVNAVFDYIEKNLARDMSLDELAEVSCFSKYHFCRMFDAVVGETPFEFIKRVRLEKAASMLQLHQEKTVTEIALDCGYNDLAVFSRNFSEWFGMSPTDFRNSTLENSNKNQTLDFSSLYLDSEENGNNNIEQLQSSEVRNITGRTVAYLRHMGPYKGEESLYNDYFSRLLSWADSRGLIDQPNAHPMAIYHDIPCVTDEQKLRLSFCLPVPPDTPVDGEIGKMHLSKGRFLVARFVVAPQNIPMAWQWVYDSWFPGSGYLPADNLPYEAYPGQSKNGKMKVDIYVPLEPL